MSDKSPAIQPVTHTFSPFSDEQLQALATLFPRIAVVTGKTLARPRWAKPGAPAPEPPWEVVFRAPTTGECDAFEGAATSDAQKPGALRTISRACVVAVSHNGVQTVHDGEPKGKGEKAVRAAWDKLRGDYPGVHLATQNELMTLMGAERDEQGKD